jgi:hypothetical protein
MTNTARRRSSRNGPDESASRASEARTPRPSLWTAVVIDSARSRRLYLVPEPDQATVRRNRLIDDSGGIGSIRRPKMGSMHSRVRWTAECHTESVTIPSPEVHSSHRQNNPASEILRPPGSPRCDLASSTPATHRLRTSEGTGRTRLPPGPTGKPSWRTSRTENKSVEVSFQDNAIIQSGADKKSARSYPRQYRLKSLGFLLP